jgi:potassium channel subfamily K
VYQEGWTYFDGIYFSVVSMLVIGMTYVHPNISTSLIVLGFGDFVPTHTSTRILLFPFAVITITQLANQISMMIGFFGARAQARKDRWWLQYEQERQLAHDLKFPRADLEREMRFLEEIHKRQDAMSTTYDLVLSLMGFIVFWMVGAALFHALEVCMSFCRFA